MNHSSGGLSDATDEWLDRHPYIDFSRQESDDGVVSVRVPIPEPGEKPEARPAPNVSVQTHDYILHAPSPMGHAEHRRRSCLAAWNLNNATCPGMFRGPSRFRLSGWSKLFVIAALVESLFLVSLSIAVALRRGSNEHPYLYSILACVCVLAFLYYAIDAVYTENSFQLFYGLVMSVVLTMIVVVSVFNKADDVSLGPVWKQTKYGLLGVKIAFQLLYLGVAWPVKQSFGYYLFKIASASLELQRLFKRFLAFFSLLKFDLLLCLIYLLMLNVADFVASDSVIIGIILIIVSVFWTFLGWLAVTKENVTLLIVFAGLAVLKLAYVIYTLYILWNHPNQITVSVTYTQYAIVGAASLSVRFLLLLFTWRVYQAFGKGLKERVFEPASDISGQSGTIFTAFAKDLSVSDVLPHYNTQPITVLLSTTQTTRWFN